MLTCSVDVARGTCVCVQVYYHLGAFEDSVTYALGADKLFNVNASTEYVETIVGMDVVACFCPVFVITVDNIDAYSMMKLLCNVTRLFVSRPEVQTVTAVSIL